MGSAFGRRRLVQGVAGFGGLAALATPAIVRAAPNRRPRVYMMLYRGWEDACDGFRDYLKSHELDVDYTIRSADQVASKVPDMVAEAKAMRPDLVYIWGTTTAVQALGPWDAADPAKYLSDIPTVFNIVVDPVGNRIVQSLERPGRNATGTLYVVPIDIQIRTVASYSPFKRMGIIYNPLERNSVLTVERLRSLLPQRDATLVEAPVRLDARGAPDPGSIPGLVRQLADQHCDWLYISPDTFLLLHRAVLTNAALEAHLPTFTSTEPFIRDANALFGLVCRYYSIGQFTGRKAEQILREGTQAKDIPVETLNRFSLLANIRVARQLDLYPPMSMLQFLEAV